MSTELPDKSPLNGEPCRISRKEATLTEFVNDAERSGSFAYTHGTLDTLSGEQKRRLALALARRKSRGLGDGWFLTEVRSPSPLPAWRAAAIPDLLAELPKPPAIFDEALLDLVRQYPELGQQIQEFSVDPYTIGALDESTRAYILNQLKYHKYIAEILTSNKYPTGNVEITSLGWARIQELQQKNADSRTAFVAMWFDNSRTTIWEDGIKQGIEIIQDGSRKGERSGFTALRIDVKQHNNKICDEIIAEIRRARFLVADFTGQRGGVYFEAGFALGLGIPVIWCVESADLKNNHFDTRQYAHIAYTGADDLRTQLSARIAATIPAVHPPPSRH